MISEKGRALNYPLFVYIHILKRRKISTRVPIEYILWTWKLFCKLPQRGHKFQALKVRGVKNSIYTLLARGSECAQNKQSKRGDLRALPPSWLAKDQGGGRPP
jgi:hypothetical protein